MPIIIKELFVSDQLSEALEKINFNFDQLLLAGGGPPGPQGPQGPQGVPGPEGDRGDHWFSGSTAPSTDHGPGFGNLQINDHWIDDQGNIKYWDGGNWISSGINLTGPTGPKGDAGGSMELGLWKGGINYNRTPDFITTSTPSSNWLPIQSTKLDVDTQTDTNFLIPVGIEKNVLFLGNQKWARFNFNNFLGYNSSITGSYPENTPKLTVIQSKIGIDGFSGIAIGAYGMTSVTLQNTTGNLNTLSGGWKPSLANQNNSEFDDARNMFYAGISIQNFDSNSKLKHIFKSRTMSLDYHIQSGSTDPKLLNGNNPSVVISANLDINLLGISQASTDDNNSDLIRVNIGPKSNRFRSPSYLGFGSNDSSLISGNLSNIPSTINLLVKNNSAILGNLYVGETTSTNSTEFSINIGRNRKMKGTSSISFFGRGGVTDIDPILKIYSLSDNNSNDNSYISHSDLSSQLGKLYITSSNTINLFSSKKIEISSSSSSSDIYSVFDNVNKRFGLGTVNPLTLAHFKGSGDIIRLEGDSVGGSNIKYYEGTTLKSTLEFKGSDFKIAHHATDGNILFSTNNINRAWIDWAGNVGIGEKSPLSRLHVNRTRTSVPITTNLTIKQAAPTTTSQLINFSIFNTNTKYNADSLNLNSSLNSFNADLFIGHYRSSARINGNWDPVKNVDEDISFIQSRDTINGNGIKNNILGLQVANNSSVSIGKFSSINTKAKLTVAVGSGSINNPNIVIEGIYNNSEPNAINKKGKIQFFPDGYDALAGSLNPNIVMEVGEYTKPYFWGLTTPISLNPYTDPFPSQDSLSGMRGWIGYDNLQNRLMIDTAGWYRSDDNLDAKGFDLGMISSGNIKIQGFVKNKGFTYPDDGEVNATPGTNLGSLIDKHDAFSFIPGVIFNSPIPDYSGGGFGGPGGIGGIGVGFQQYTLEQTKFFPRVSINGPILEPTNEASTKAATIIYGGDYSYQNHGIRLHADETTIGTSSVTSKTLLSSIGTQTVFRNLNTGSGAAISLKIGGSWTDLPYGNLSVIGNKAYVGISPTGTPYETANLLGKSPLDISIPELGNWGHFNIYSSTNTSNNIKLGPVKTTWRKINPPTGQSLDFCRYVILLHPAAIGAEANAVEGSLVSGKFYMIRGGKSSLAICNVYTVNSLSGWNGNVGTVEAQVTYDSRTTNPQINPGSNSSSQVGLSHISDPRDCYLTVVTYGGRKWVALYPGYILQGHDIFFDGTVTSSYLSSDEYFRILRIETIRYSSQYHPGTNSLNIDTPYEVFDQTLKDEVIKNRFYSNKDTNETWSGLPAATSNEEARGSVNPLSDSNNPNPKYRGSYSKTHTRSVLYVDGLGFNQTSLRERYETDDTLNTSYIGNKNYGHIAGIEMIHLRIHAPIVLDTDVNSSGYLLSSNWPVTNGTPAYHASGGGYGIQVFNSVGIAEVSAVRGRFRRSSSIGLLWYEHDYKDQNQQCKLLIRTKNTYSNCSVIPEIYIPDQYYGPNNNMYCGKISWVQTNTNSPERQPYINRIIEPYMDYGAYFNSDFRDRINIILPIWHTKNSTDSSPFNTISSNSYLHNLYNWSGRVANGSNYKTSYLDVIVKLTFFKGD